MSTYHQFCPIALAAEVLAERWTPLIVREIVLADHHRFSEIQRGVGRISTSLLADRLTRLEEAGVIERRPNPAGRGSEYHPTPAGRELERLLDDLAIWAQHWMELRAEDLDPAYLMQSIHVHLRTERLPPTRTTVRFDFLGDQRPYWLLLARDGTELCFHDPGYEVDLAITSDLEALTRVYLGRLRLVEAVERDLVRIEGPSPLVRAFPQWLGLSRWAPYATELVARAS